MDTATTVESEVQNLSQHAESIKNDATRTAALISGHQLPWQVGKSRHASTA